MRVEIEAAVIAVGGALLVWIVSWVWSLHLDRRTGKRVRKMLYLEIDLNLQALSNWWAGTKPRTFAGDPLASALQVDAIRRNNLPLWNQRIWQAVTAMVPVALNEMEIQSVFGLYRRLDQLSDSMQRENGQRSELYTTVKSIVEDTLSKGNPLD